MRATAATPEHLRWLEGFVPVTLSPNATGIAAVAADGLPRGVVAYEPLGLATFQMHWGLASPIALRCLLPAVFEYPFQQCRAGVLAGLIRESNLASLATAKHLGMRETHRIAGGWGPCEDLVLLELRADECRYLHRKAA